MINDLANMVVSSRVRIARNFVGFPFPRKLDACSTDYDFTDIFRYAKTACDKVEKNNFYYLNNLSEPDRMALVESRLISTSLLSRLEIGGVIVSSDEKFSVMINEEDHIRMQCILDGLDLDNAYARVNRYDNALLDTYPLAYDNKLGFLTSCPTNLGTGMRASVMMFLPAVTENGEIEQIIHEAKQSHIVVRGAYGEGSKSYGYMYQISNGVSLGLTEQEIIEGVKHAVKQIAYMENEARQKYFNDEGLIFVDKAYRAYGLLTNARIMDNKEFIELVSILKLAIALKIIPFENKKLDELVVRVQPNNLCKIFNKQMSVYEQNEKRAKLIRETLLG